MHGLLEVPPCQCVRQPRREPPAQRRLELGALAGELFEMPMDVTVEGDD